jgi:hypothetical protein
MVPLVLLPYVEIVNPWPLLILCGLFLVFVVYCFTSDA